MALATKKLRRVQVIGNHVSENGRDGIVIADEGDLASGSNLDDAINGCIIANNVSDTNDSDGIYISGATIDMVGETATDGSTKHVVTGNHLGSNGAYGMNIWGTENNLVGNTFLNNGSGEIIDSGISTKITGNTPSSVNNIVKTVFFYANAMRDAVKGSPSGEAIDDVARVWRLDASTEEGSSVVFAVPEDWNGIDSVVLHWSKHASGTGNVVWRIRSGSPADGAAIAASANSDQTIAVPSTAHFLKQSSGFTLGGVVAGDSVFIGIIRIAADGADTYADDAEIVGLEINYVSTD